MNVHVFLLLFFLSFSFFAAVCPRLSSSWSCPVESSSQGAFYAPTSAASPRSPDDYCPACRLASTASSGRKPMPAPVQPWSEVKSRWEAPKRIPTEGLDPSAASRVFVFRQATITTGLTRSGSHAHTLHERFFAHLRLPHIQLDELRTRLRSHAQAQWLWLALDPTTKIHPVLELGPRTQHMAHLVLHSLRQILAPGYIPLFTSDGLNFYFYALLRPSWTLVPGVLPRAESPPVVGGCGSDLRSGEEKLTFGASWCG